MTRTVNRVSRLIAISKSGAFFGVARYPRLQLAWPTERLFSLFLDRDFMLTYFAEPEPTGGDRERAERYRRVPWFHIIEWKKPLGSVVS